MKKILSILSVFIISIVLVYGQGSDSPRQIHDFNYDWIFFEGDPSGAHLKKFNDKSWEKVQIPHDWAISKDFDHNLSANTGKLPWKGTGWYRKYFSLNVEKDQRVYFIFDGIMAFPEIYINGKKAGEWDYGYNSFYLDVTDFVEKNGNNLIAVKADTRQHASRWYPGAGIYRKVTMLVTGPVHTAVWGSYITTPQVTERLAKVRAIHEIVNTSLQETFVEIRTSIINPEGITMLTDSETVTLKANSNKNIIEQWFNLTAPVLWDLDNPVMYTVKTDIYKDRVLQDSYTTAIGLRYFEFTADKGFFLNGKHVQLKGVNLHHDHGPLGAKFYTRAMQRQIEIMKEMGCNAIRTSHNTPSPELLSLCDTMGILVIDEIFDKWNETADIRPNVDFDEFAERNVRNFILRDRNHPSIILWSAGNEIHEVQVNADGGLRKLHTMVNLINKYDPRPVTLVNDNTGSVYFQHFDFYDIHSWNYGRRYLPARGIDPSKAVIITESASTISTRGFYELPLPAQKINYGKGLQISSYDMNAPWWAEAPDFDFHWQELDEFVAGEFVWTGFDYLGEPTPFNDQYVEDGKITKEESSRSSYFGIVDLCGIPKDRFYLYKSVWKPEEDMIHVLPHWNWKDTYDSLPVFVYTTGDCAEIFVNGVSQGKKCKMPLSDESYKRYRIMWNSVKFEEGSLRAVAYKEGKIIKDTTIHTAGEVNEFRLCPDRTTINSSGQDLSYVLIEAFDKSGNFCPLANDGLKIKVTGPAVLEGAGNGNPQSFEPFTNDTVNLFYGKAMVIVRGLRDEKGAVSIEIENSNGLRNSIDLQVD